MHATSIALTRPERAVLDNAMRLLTDTLSLDDATEAAQLNLTLRVWRKLTEAIVVELHEVEA